MLSFNINRVTTNFVDACLKMQTITKGRAKHTDISGRGPVSILHNNPQIASDVPSVNVEIIVTQLFSSFGIYAS